MHSIFNGQILVTGGAGFIGSALIWALNQRDFSNILVTDLLGEGDKFRNLVPLRFNDYIEADHFLDRLEARPDTFDKVKTVFHLGACSSTTEKNARFLIENNYEYSKRLALWCLRKDIRFVYASSAATYGDGAQGMDDKDERISRLRPLNMYGYSKQLFDHYAQRHGFLDKVVGLKYFNIFGPNEGHKGDMRSVVHKAFGQIRDSGEVKLFKSYRPEYKDGCQQRDFLYVKDAVEMTLHLAESEGAGGLYNIGSGQANTWLDLVSPIFKLLKRPTNIRYIEMPEHLRTKYQYYTCADIAKLRATGYDLPHTPLTAAVIDYVQNYLLPGHRLGE